MAKLNHNSSHPWTNGAAWTNGNGPWTNRNDPWTNGVQLGQVGTILGLVQQRLIFRSSHAREQGQNYQVGMDAAMMGNS